MRVQHQRSMRSIVAAGSMPDGQISHFKPSPSASRSCASKARIPRKAKVPRGGAGRCGLTNHNRTVPPQVAQADRQGSILPHRESLTPMSETVRPTGRTSTAPRSRAATPLIWPQPATASSNRRLQCSGTSCRSQLRSIDAPSKNCPTAPS